MRIDDNNPSDIISIEQININLSPNQFCAFKLSLPIKEDIQLLEPIIPILNTLSYRIIEQSNDRT
jgi:hypothetical protein